MQEIDQGIKDIKAAKLDVTEEGTLEDFLVVIIDQRRWNYPPHATTPYEANP